MEDRIDLKRYHSNSSKANSTAFVHSSSTGLYHQLKEEPCIGKSLFLGGATGDNPLQRNLFMNHLKKRWQLVHMSTDIRKRGENSA